MKNSDVISDREAAGLDHPNQMIWTDLDDILGDTLAVFESLVEQDKLVLAGKITNVIKLITEVKSELED
jgi:hypothetical protein